MFTTPPAALLITGLFTGPSTGRNYARSRGRHAVAQAVTAAAAAGLLAGCASASTHQAGTAPGGGAAASCGKTATPGGTAVGSGTSNGSASSGTAGRALCQPVTAHWLRVYAPGETQALYVSHTFDACSSSSAALLTVMPVRSGQGVQGTTP